MLACAVWFLICVAIAIHHTCFSHTCHLAIHHTCLSHTWYLKHFRPATRISTLGYNSALLSVTNLCARYILYFVCLSSSTNSSDQYKKRALQSQYHYLTGIMNQPPVVPLTACVGKSLVRRFHLLWKVTPLQPRSHLVGITLTYLFLFLCFQWQEVNRLEITILRVSTSVSAKSNYKLL